MIIIVCLARNLLCWCRGGIPWRSASPPDNANGLDDLLASEVLDISNLGKEIDLSLQCRNYESNSPGNHPRYRWEYVRMESQAITTSAAASELGVKFECTKYESIHIAEGPCQRRG